MTLALAVVFFALLLLYCGIKGRSLKDALVGRSSAGATGGLVK